jgi:hypothetical protein
MMTCEQFRERLDDTARDDASAAAALRDALAHADSCPGCDALLEEAESLTGALRGWARRDATEAPRRVEEVLLAAFRRQHDAVSAREISRPKSVRLFCLSALGIAAAVFLVIFLVRNTNRATPPVGKSQPRIAIPSEAPAQRPYPGAPSPRQVLSASAADDENAADSFVSLSDTFDPSSLEDDTVVRVILSPSALASLGFAVVEDRDSGNVAADLLLARDGTPEAIRLVGEGDPDRSVAILSELH